MAVYTLTDCATTRTTSRWGSCMHSDRHTVGDADLFNDQVGKIGKNRHRLILDQEMGALEILFCPLFYHIAIIGAAEEPKDASEHHPISLLSIGLGAWNSARICFKNSAYMGVKSQISWQLSTHKNIRARGIRYHLFR